MQKSDFLSSFTTPLRASLIRTFALNDRAGFPLTEVAKRAGVSPKVAQKEVRALIDIGIVKEVEGEGKSPKERVTGTRYFFNERCKYANALATFVHEVTPENFDDVERALRSAGKMSTIVLSGIFIGDMKRPADLLLVADSVNEKRLENALRRFEPKYGREIRYTVFSTPEFRYRMTINDKLLRDTLDYPHRLLLNKKNLI